MDLTVSVPPRYQQAFWRMAPRARWCWVVKEPTCEVGGKIVWRMNRCIVAQAAIAAIVPRRPGSRWHLVHWDGASFEDLREDLGPDFKPQIYGGYVWRDAP